MESMNNLVSRAFPRWSWSRIFGLTYRLLWKNRCKGVFEGTSDHPRVLLNRCSFLLIEGVENGRFKHLIFQIPERANHKWSPPPNGFTQVDVDGSVNNQGNKAVGGVLRTDQGSWLSGFLWNIGYASTTTAEALAIGTGLQMCKSHASRVSPDPCRNLISIKDLMDPSLGSSAQNTWWC